MADQRRKQGHLLRSKECRPRWISGKHFPGQGVRLTGVGIYILQLTDYEALGKWLHLSEL